MPFLRQAHGLSYDQAGFLVSCQSAGNLAAVLLVGVLPAYLGRRRTILATSVWMTAGYFILTSGLGLWPLLLAACVMVGFARGGNTNFANTMVSTLPERKAARGYNLLHGAFAVGALLSPLLLVFFESRVPGIGWRATAGLLCALTVVQVTVYGRMALPPERPVHGFRQMDLGFLRVKTFWMATVMLFFYISVEYAISGWMVTYFQDIGVLSASHAQLMNSLFWVVMFAGRMAGAAIAGKIPQSRLLLLDGTGLCVFFLVMFFSRTPAVVILSLMAVALFMATIYPTAFAFGSASVRGNDMGCSVMTFLATFGGVLTPALVGLVAERAGIAAGMAVVAGATLLLLCAILFSAFFMRRSADGHN